MPSELWRNRTEDLEYYTKEENKSSVSEGKSLLWERFLAFPLLCFELQGTGSVGWISQAPILLASDWVQAVGVQKAWRNQVPPSPVPLALCLLCGSGFSWDLLITPLALSSQREGDYECLLSVVSGLPFPLFGFTVFPLCDQFSPLYSFCLSAYSGFTFPIGNLNGI